MGALETRLQSVGQEQDERARHLEEVKERCSQALQRLEESEETSEKNKTQVFDASFHNTAQLLGVVVENIAT